MNIGNIEGAIIFRDQMSGPAEQATRSAHKLRSALSPLEQAARSFSSGINYLRGSIAGVSFAAFANQVIQAQRSMDQMRNSLVVATGSIAQANVQIGYVREQSAKLGLDFQSAGKGFAWLAAASRDTGVSMSTVQRIFEAVSQSATALGLDSTTTAGAMNAMVQMMTKGTIQAEELRGQLGDRIPGAVQMMARALGVSTAQLNKMLEAGTVLSADALPKLADEMLRVYSAGAQLGASSLNAELNRVKTAFFELFEVISNNVVLKDIVRGVGELVNHLKELIANEGGATSAIKAIGDAIRESLGFIGTLIELLNQIDALIKSIGGQQALAVLNPLKMLADGLALLNEKIAWLKDNAPGLWEKLQVAVVGVSTSAEGASGWFNEMASAAERAEAAAIDAIRQQREAEHPGMGTQAGPVQSMADIEARNKSYARSAHETLQKITKDFKEMYKAQGKAFDLEDRLRDEAKALEVFQKILKENGGDFKKAELHSKAYLEVLKAGLDPLVGWGKALYEQAVNTALGTQALKDREQAQDDFNRNVQRMEEDAIETRKAMDKAYQDLASDLAKYTVATYGNISALEKANTNELRLYKARLQGADAVREVNRAMAIEEALLQNIAREIPVGSQEWQNAAAKIRATMNALFDFMDAQEELEETWGGLAAVFRDTDFGNDGLNQASEGIASLIDGFKRLQQASVDGAKISAEAWATAIGSMLQGVQSLIAATGTFQTGNGGGFGGSSEGNYAAEGQAIGAIIGGIIGAFFAAPQVGAAIGSAAGGILGGFIKKAADESLAQINFDATTQTFKQKILVAEGELRGAMSDLGIGISKTIQDIVSQIGGTIEGLPAVSMKIRDGVIGIVVGGVKAKFKEMDDAISFAVAEMLKQGSISGIDEMLAQALQGTQASSLEGLAADLDAVMKVLSFGMTESQQAVLAFTNEMDGLRSTIDRLNLSVEQTARAYANINTEEIRRWQDSRDALTGQKRSRKEQLEMLKLDATMWNAEKALRIAELKLKRDALQGQMDLVQIQGTLSQQDLLRSAVYLEGKATHYKLEQTLDQQALSAMRYADALRAGLLANDIDITNIQTQGWAGYLEARQKYVQGDVDTSQWHLKALGQVNSAALASLQVIMDSLDAMIAALEAMPDIDIPSLKLPGGLGGGKGAGIDKVADAFSKLGLESVALDNRMDDLAAALSYLTSKGKISAEQLAELGNQLFTDLLGQMASVIQDEKTLRALEEIRYDIQKANWAVEIERLKLMGAINDEQYQKLLGYLNALPEDLPGLDVDPAAEIEGIIDSFGLPLEALRDGYAEQEEAMYDLLVGVREGTVSAERFAQVMSELGMEANMTLSGMAADILEKIGKSKEAAKLKYEIEKMEFKMKLIEFRMAIEHYLAIGAISADIAAIWYDILAQGEAFQWPAFRFDEGGRDGGRDGGRGEGEDPWDDFRRAIDRLRSAIDALREFSEGLNQSALSPLTIAQQFADAQARYQQILAAAQAGDITAMEQLPEAAQQFLELAGQMFGTAGLGYQQIFQMVRDQIDAVADMGDAFLETLPPEFQEVTDRLDTIAELIEFLNTHGLPPVEGQDAAITSRLDIIAAILADTNANRLWNPTHTAPPSGRGLEVNTVAGAFFTDTGDQVDGVETTTGESRVLTVVSSRLGAIERNTRQQNVLTFDGNRQARYLATMTPTTKTSQLPFTRRRGG